ncbi:hypothetical protein H5410_030800, partial [Solanum commersonii]
MFQCEGKDQVGDEREKSERHRTVSRRNTISRNNSKCKDLQIRFHLRVFGLRERELERVNSRPSPTYLARESEWSKRRLCLITANWCSRKTDLIR